MRSRRWMCAPHSPQRHPFWNSRWNCHPPNSRPQVRPARPAPRFLKLLQQAMRAAAPISRPAKSFLRTTRRRR